MRKLQNELITQDSTTVYSEERVVFNAPHNYYVTKSEDDTPLAMIHFQEGPNKEAGVNGVHHEDLIAIVIDRLEHFQASNFKCEENQKAICLLQDTLRVLRSRTNKRADRGVLGTSTV